MNDYICKLPEGTPDSPKIEPVKVILEDIDSILKELGNELDRIDEAIYSPGLKENAVSDPMNECMLGALNRQRSVAKNLLKTAVHIREGLW